MLKRAQMVAIVELAKTPRRGYDATIEARRIGITPTALRVHVCNVRMGRLPPCWRRILGESK